MVSTRRRSRGTVRSKYSIGDKVEILRRGEVDIGTLLYEAEKHKKSGTASSGSTGSSSSKRWVVSVTGSSDEEEISESSLGRVLSVESLTDIHPQTVASPTTTAANTAKSSKLAASATVPYSNTTTAATATAAQQPKSSKTVLSHAKKASKKLSAASSKHVKPTKASSPVTATTAATPYTTSHEKATSRRQVTTRAAYATRQNHTNQQELFTGIEVEPHKIKAAVAAAVASGSTIHKPARKSLPRRKLPPPTKSRLFTNTKLSTSKSKRKSSDEETVIEVKLLTGTLYMYRGNRPRAEFVRVV